MHDMEQRIGEGLDVRGRVGEDWAQALERELQGALQAVPGARATCHPDRDSCKRRRARGEACKRAQAEVDALGLSERAVEDARRALEQALRRDRRDEDLSESGISDSIRALVDGEIERALESLEDLELDQGLEDVEDALEQLDRDWDPEGYDDSEEYDSEEDDADEFDDVDESDEDDPVSWSEVVDLSELDGDWVLVQPDGGEVDLAALGTSLGQVVEPLRELSASFQPLAGVEMALGALEQGLPAALAPAGASCSAESAHEEEHAKAKAKQAKHAKAHKDKAKQKHEKKAQHADVATAAKTAHQTAVAAPDSCCSSSKNGVAAAPVPVPARVAAPAAPAQAPTAAPEPHTWVLPTEPPQAVVVAPRARRAPVVPTEPPAVPFGQHDPLIWPATPEPPRPGEWVQVPEPFPAVRGAPRLADEAALDELRALMLEMRSDMRELRGSLEELRRELRSIAPEAKHKASAR